MEIWAQVGKDAYDEFKNAPASTPARTSFGQAIFKSSTPKEVAQVTPLKENSVRKLMNKEVPAFQAYLRSLVWNTVLFTNLTATLGLYSQSSRLP
jgi:hypothetical protein